MVSHTWGQKADVVIYFCLVIVRVRMAVFVTAHASLSMTAVMTFMILDVVVSYAKECTFQVGRVSVTFKLTRNKRIFLKKTFKCIVMPKTRIT